MRETMCKLWTNFAKYGNPTPQHENSLNFKWLPDKRKSTHNYLLIQETPKMLENVKIKSVNFWKDIYEKYNGSFEIN